MAELGSHQDLTFLEDRVIKSSSTNAGKLRAEIAWLQEIHPDLARYVPNVLTHRTERGVTTYEMDRFAGRSLAEHVFSETCDLARLSTLLSRICELLSSHWYVVASAESTFDHFEQNYIEKTFRRMETLDAGDPIRTFFSEPQVTVNGRSYRGAADLLAEMPTRSDLRRLLRPPYLSFFHGDFKLDNILASDDFQDFMLIDPRGITPNGSLLSDPADDFAKMRTSTLAYYDVVRTGQVHVELDGSAMTWAWRMDRDVRARLIALDVAVLAAAESYAKTIGDDSALYRMRCITALLLVANAPFQIVSGIAAERRIAEMLCGLGTVLLNQALSTANSGEGPEA
jgi:hypothetical protein